MAITVFAWDSLTTYHQVVTGGAELGTLFHNVVTSKEIAKGIIKRILGDPVFGGSGAIVGDVNFRGHVYKIGMTVNPIKRARDHENPLVDPTTRTRDPELWDRMHVVYRCTVQDDVRNAETELMACATSEFGSSDREEHSPGQDVFSLNFRAGGAGRPSSAESFYAYLLLSRA
jgi:hypothetical protein